MAAETPGLDSIFCAAIEIASSLDRAAYIARACGSDVDLLSRVERLVEAHFRAGSFLEGGVPGTVVSREEPIGEIPGAVIGPYKLLQQIGEGAWAPSSWRSSASRSAGEWR